MVEGHLGGYTLRLFVPVINSISSFKVCITFSSSLCHCIGLYLNNLPNNSRESFSFHFFSPIPVPSENCVFHLPVSATLYLNWRLISRFNSRVSSIRYSSGFCQLEDIFSQCYLKKHFKDLTMAFCPIPRISALIYSHSF